MQSAARTSTGSSENVAQQAQFSATKVVGEELSVGVKMKNGNQGETDDTGVRVRDPKCTKTGAAVREIEIDAHVEAKWCALDGDIRTN